MWHQHSLQTKYGGAFCRTMRFQETRTNATELLQGVLSLRILISSVHNNQPAGVLELGSETSGQS